MIKNIFSAFPKLYSRQQLEKVDRKRKICLPHLNTNAELDNTQGNTSMQLKKVIQSVPVCEFQLIYNCLN